LKKKKKKKEWGKRIAELENVCVDSRCANNPTKQKPVKMGASENSDFLCKEKEEEGSFWLFPISQQ